MLASRSLYNSSKWSLTKISILLMIKRENSITIFFGDVIKLKLLTREVE